MGRFPFPTGKPSPQDQLFLRTTGRNCSSVQDTYPNRSTSWPRLEEIDSGPEHTTFTQLAGEHVDAVDDRCKTCRLVSGPLADAGGNACRSQITMLDRDTDLIREVLACPANPELREW